MTDHTLHASTFSYLKPTEYQMKLMEGLREASRYYADLLDAELPDGPDKTYILRRVRETAMWVNVAITRHADGRPRTDEEQAGSSKPNPFVNVATRPRRDLAPDMTDDNRLRPRDPGDVRPLRDPAA